jgi:hypothetical protein
MKRTFDLKNKTGSRYMVLAEHATTNVTDLRFDDTSTPAQQYSARLVPLANISTIDASISAGVQADVALKFGYKNCGLSVDLGYNLWARSKESTDTDLEIANITNFTLKGDAQVVGFVTGGGGAATNLTVSQSAATLFAVPALANGGTNTNPTVAAEGFTNLSVDNPDLAENAGAVIIDQFSVAGGNAAPALAPAIAAARVNISKNIVPLTNADIDEDSGLSKSAISHKVFGHISYAWEDECAVDPFVGVGASVEFASNGTTNATTTSSKGCALSQWRVELKGGIAF